MMAATYTKVVKTAQLARLQERSQAGPASRLQPLRVIEAVARATGYPVAELRGHSHKPGPTLARHIAFYLLRTLCGLPSTRAGELMGGADHSTVLYGVRRAKAAMEGPGQVRQLVEAISGALLALEAAEPPICS